MATFYVGSRPILRGRSTANMKNPYKGNKVGTYSYWINYSTDNILAGAPDNNNVPGTGARPGNRFLSQVFNGTALYVHPLANPIEDGYGLRFKPNEYKGLSGAAAFSSGYGHADRNLYYGNYNNFVYDGVPCCEALANSSLGHGVRTDKTGAPSSFGTFYPDTFKGADSTTVFPSGYGQANTANSYGRYKVNEYKGLTSTKAL